MTTTVRLYDPARQRVLVSRGPGYATHLTDGHGRVLCQPVKDTVMQRAFGTEPSCGWCRLIHDTKEA